MMETKITHNNLEFEKESYAIRGAIFEVYRELGCGFLESVYQECLEIEMSYRDIPYVSQQELKLTYKGEELNHTFKPDFICYGQILMEIKAVKEVCDDHRAILHNYLKASKLKLGFLVNFGNYPKVAIERIVK